MDRLTKVDGIGQNEIIKCFGCGLEKAGAKLEHCGYCEHWQAVVDRLAAYEDTGLEPEEMPTGLELAYVYAAMLLLKRYQALGPIEEMSALIKAREEGRVVVLPEDGMLYYFEEIPETGEKWVGNKPIQKIIFSCGFGLVGIPFDFSQLGKTVFLTRAEAEAAIGGGGDG